MLKVVSDQKDFCSVVSMCFLTHRISFIPSAEDFAFISLDVLMLVLSIPDLICISRVRAVGHSARLRSIELRVHSRGSFGDSSLIDLHTRHHCGFVFSSN